MIDPTKLTLPVIQIAADTLPEAWEQSVLAVWANGASIKTQYDKPEDLRYTSGKAHEVAS